MFNPELFAIGKKYFYITNSKLSHFIVYDKKKFTLKFTKSIEFKTKWLDGSIKMIEI
jgi:hypothetical protein